jgi:hypothetical protein
MEWHCSTVDIVFLFVHLFCTNLHERHRALGLPLASPCTNYFLLVVDMIAWNNRNHETRHIISGSPAGSDPRPRGQHGPLPQFQFIKSTPPVRPFAMINGACLRCLSCPPLFLHAELYRNRNLPVVYFPWGCVSGRIALHGLCPLWSLISTRDNGSVWAIQFWGRKTGSEGALYCSISRRKDPFHSLFLSKSVLKFGKTGYWDHQMT